VTSKEYLSKFLSGLNVSEDDIDIILLKSSIDADAAADAAACDRAVYSRMSVILKGAAQNVSEGGYSVSWNMEAVRMFYSSLCNELGLDNVLDGRPKVRNRSDFW
jgi:hypothetical protein